jgi:HSP20 family protein
MLPVLINRGRGLLGSPLEWSGGVDVVDRLHRDFDRLVTRALGESWDGGEFLPYNVDVREDEGHYYVEAEMPGLGKDDIQITVENGVLTIAGEKKASNDQQKGDFHIRERRYGKFLRQFTLPSAVDEEKVNAVLKDGILTITLDKREEVKPKKISVNAG